MSDTGRSSDQAAALSVEFQNERRDATEAEQALYNLLHKALAAVDVKDLDAAEIHLLDALDGMTGFCARRWRLFGDVTVRFKEDDGDA